MNTTWSWIAGSTLTLEKVKSSLIPAERIYLESKDQLIDKSIWPEIMKILSTQLRGNIFCLNNQISTEFFNKQFHFIAKEIRAQKTDDDFQDLLDKFQVMQIESNSCFLVTDSTIFEYYESQNTVVAGIEEDIILKMDRIGGMHDIIKQLKDSMSMAINGEKHNSFHFMPRSVLLIGQHGCGKTLLCDAITEKCDALVIKITASDIFSKYFGDTEIKLQNYFDKAYKNYPNASIIIIEEISSICPRESKEESTKRVQMAFLNILDEIHTRKDASRLFLLTTTSNIDNVNVAVRRYGRLDVEIEIPVPDPGEREQILLKHLQIIHHNLTENDIRTIASNSHGFIASDLSSLVARAVIHANRDNLNEEQIIRLVDIQYAYGHIVPSAMKEVIIKCPNVNWSDIGGQHKLKLQLKQAIEWPLTHPEIFTRLGISPPRGILMFGPPGCSKTLIAKALATESNVNFLSIKGPELFSMWVGESERAVRDLFHKARQVAPAIIFFDEIDAIGSERSSSSSGSSVKERVLTQLLTEMDGVNALTNVTIVAATNRPDIIDKALLRPGRLDRIIYVRLPDAQTRHEIFHIKLSKMPTDESVNIEALVEQTEGYSGAEIQAICQEAAFYALEDDMHVEKISGKYFTKAIMNIRPRTSPELLKLYDEYSAKGSKT